MTPVRKACACACVLGSLSWLPVAAVPRHPVTEGQRTTARQVAQTGVALAELVPHAPASHRVAPGDTLWAIAGLFLRDPWRWPELWGMNLEQIADPHWIYPGQMLYLQTRHGRAWLSPEPVDGKPPVVYLAPGIRPVDEAGRQPLPTLPSHVIAPFLDESMIVDGAALAAAPRIVASQDDRVLLGVGDRVYARADTAELLTLPEQGRRRYRIVRAAPPIVHPQSGQLLGYAAHTVGRAELLQAGRAASGTGADRTAPVAATLVVRSVRQEVQLGDRLLPEPPLEIANYLPHAPQDLNFRATVVALADDWVGQAGQHQVVLIDKGRADGLDAGTVLAMFRHSAPQADPTALQLPDEQLGVLMVFRVFPQLSYALILQTRSPVLVGDRIRPP
jgi:hypothetical protein